MSTPRAPRNTVTPERLVAVAVQMADEVGLEGLTIRALAERLGVRPMALYHHVPNKDALLDAIVDAVFAEIEPPSPDGPWRTQLEKSAVSKRAALIRHPWALALLETRTNPGPANLTHHEAVLDVLRSAGFTLAATAHAYAVLDAYTYGFALQEIMLRAAGLTDDIDEVAAGMALHGRPRLAEFVSEYALQPGYDFADSWQPGLDIVLDGLERLVMNG